MKELRFDAADGVWRVAFAFDPRRSAILLVGGSKSGTPEKRFYRELIRIAEQEHDPAIRAEAISRLRLLGTPKAKAYLELHR